MDFDDPRYKTAIFNQFMYNEFQSTLADIEFYDKKYTSFEDFMKADNVYEGLGLDYYINQDYENNKELYESVYGENTMAIHFPDDEDAELYKLTKDPNTGKWNYGDIGVFGRTPEIQEEFKRLKRDYNRDISRGYIGEPHEDKRLEVLLEYESDNPILKTLVGEKKSMLKRITDSFFTLPGENSAMSSAYEERREDYEEGTDGYLYQMGVSEFGGAVYNRGEFSTDDFNDENLDDNFIFSEFVDSGLISQELRDEIRRGWEYNIRFKYQIPNVAPSGRLPLDPENTNRGIEGLIEEGKRILREEDVDYDDLSWMDDEEAGMNLEVPQIPAFRFPYEYENGFDLLEFLGDVSDNGLDDEVKMKQTIYRITESMKDIFNPENFDLDSKGNLFQLGTNREVLSNSKFLEQREIREEADGGDLGDVDEESRVKPILRRSRMEAREDEEPVRDVLAEAEEDKQKKVRPESDFPSRVENIRVGEDEDTIERSVIEPVSSSGALVYGFQRAGMYDTAYQAQADIIQLEERRRPRPIIRRRDRQPVEEQRRPRPIIRRRR